MEDHLISLSDAWSHYEMIPSRWHAVSYWPARSKKVEALISAFKGRHSTFMSAEVTIVANNEDVRLGS